MYNKKQLEHLYHTGYWKNTTTHLKRKYPLCLYCKHIKEYYEGSKEIHHIIPVSLAEDWEEVNELFYETTNHLPLCKGHHYDLEQRLRHAPQYYVRTVIGILIENGIDTTFVIEWKKKILKIK